MSCQCTWIQSSPGTFLEAAFDAVRDGHPPLRDELIQDARGHCRLKPIQRPLSGLCTETTKQRIVTFILLAGAPPEDSDRCPTFYRLCCL